MTYPSADAPTERPLDTIHKYVLRPPGQTTELNLPVGAVPALVGDQAGLACIWMRHPKLPPTEVRTFRIVGTGEVLFPYEQHLGSFQVGGYVWHVVEEINSSATLEAPSGRAQALSTGLAGIGFHVTPEQAQIALNWRQGE